MRRRLTMAAVWAAAIALSVPVRGQGDSPRLLVTIAVDQMRADYLTVLQRHWQGGFRTLLAEGAVFERAEYPYLHTVTCAGHATIATGAFPRTHGMVGNEWWDRGSRKVVDCAIDERAESAHVSYGRPARLGNSAHFLLAPTLGDELRSQRPGARVVSFSLKPDAAIALAGHAADVIAWFDQEAGTFVTSRAFAGRAHPALAEFLSRDSHERDYGRPWTLLLPDAAYLFADATLGQRPAAGRDGLFPHQTSGPNPLDAPRLWQRTPFSDRYLARMADAMVEALELGQRGTPDVLTISFSALDLVGHAHGPESREVEDVLVNLDRTLGTLIGALDRRVGRGRYVIALSADHGVAPTPQPGSGGRVVREDVQERVEEILRTEWGARDEGPYVESFQSAYLYFAPGVFSRLRADRALWARVHSAVTAIPGIARVVPADELSASSSDAAIRAASLGYVRERSGDLAIVPARNWVVLPRASANATTHGGLELHDRHVPLILFGGGVRPGRYAQPATPADIAPTLASLVGISMPRAEGRVLREALASTVSRRF